MDCSFYELLIVSGQDHHEDFSRRSSMKIGLARHVINSIDTADGILDCKSIDLCRSEANERHFVWENTPGKPGPES
jgi:hypothetical protein